MRHWVCRKLGILPLGLLLICIASALALPACTSSIAEPLQNADTPSWHVVKVSDFASGTLPEAGPAIGVAAAGSYPALVFEVFDPGRGAAGLRFARANDKLGSAWGAPRPLDLGAVEFPWLYLCFTEVAGRPAVAIGNRAWGDPLYYMRAGDEQGLVWPLPGQVGAAADVDSDNNLRLIDLAGVPALAYLTGFGSEIRFIRGADADGSSFMEPVTLDSSPNIDPPLRYLDDADLALIGGRPAVVYRVNYSHPPHMEDVPDEVRYIRAGDAAGNSWGGSVLVTSSNSGYRSCALIEMAGGLPGVFYSTFATQGYTMLRAYLSLSETATGGPWGEGFAVFTSNSTEDFRQLDPLNLAGRPALGCIGERWEGTEIHNAVFAQAATADGTAWTDGQTVWHCGVNGNADFTSLGTMPVAVIYDDLDKAIYFAAYY